MKAHRLSPSDKRFLEDFQACRIEPSAFHHREHLRLAYVLLASMELQKARRHLKEDLLRFLAHHGIDPSGYHETLTGAWLLAVRHFMSQSPSDLDSEGFIEMNPRLLDKEVLLSHYSRDLLDSEAAKAAFLPADIDPIPFQELLFQGSSSPPEPPLPQRA